VPGKKDILKQEIKLKILRVALKLVEKSGWDNMSVRKISEKINYSTIKIYQEFGSKEGLLHELQKEGSKELTAYVEKAVARSKTPTDKLLNVSLAVWDFADNKPHFFQLMFGVNGAPLYQKKERSNHEIGYFLWQQLEETIPKNDLSLMYNWWALVYGHILTDSFAFFSKDELRAMFKKSIERFIEGIK
jgi:AcrR family transcriptional regulator